MIYILDNEALQLLKNVMAKNNTSYQQALTQQHRRNATEQAIGTFKNYFLVGLASVDPEFPISEWVRLVAQSTFTLNLLWDICGNFIFNSTPLAPPRTITIAQEKLTHGVSWALSMHH